jgi:hypothetical protein
MPPRKVRTNEPRSSQYYRQDHRLERVTGDLDSAVITLADRSPLAVPSGTGSGQADLQWSDTRTVGTGGETLDLNALTDSLGRTINFVKIKALLIVADPANSSTIVVGNAASNQFQGPFDAATDTVALPAGGILMLAAPAAGWASTNGASDKLKVVGGAASQIYSIWILGTSA